ncbi:MAG: hypothetical protein M1832_006162 [Thelocarpon impressellum]|nr:MAG: hypothetical protein M1832_006162 [Thelocarpon impressellum]
MQRLPFEHANDCKFEHANTLNSSSFGNTSTTASEAAPKTSSGGCVYKTPIFNSGFERHGSGDSPPWKATSLAGNASFVNVPGSLDHPVHGGRRQGLIIAKSTDDVITLSQMVRLCPRSMYTFYAWTRQPTPGNRCTAVFSIGGYPVDFTNVEDRYTEYRQIGGMFGPANTNYQEVEIQVKCAGEPDARGEYRIYLDDIKLRAA